MKQTVLIERPPVYEQCVKAFGIKPGQPILFAWGDKIYNPENAGVTPELFAHEEVHGHRQVLDLDGNRTDNDEAAIKTWWNNYLYDLEFRVTEEAFAHVAEYAAYARRHPNRKKREHMLRGIAARLSGPLYGNMIPFDRAVEIVRAA